MKLFLLKTTGGARPDYYIAAHTNIEALATLFMDCELSFDDLDYEDKMIEIPEREWDELKLTYSPIETLEIIRKIVYRKKIEKPSEMWSVANEMKGRKYSEVLACVQKD